MGKLKLSYTKAQYEHIMSIVMRMDYFRADNREILEELRNNYPEFPPTYTVLNNIRKKIKYKNIKEFKTIRKSNTNFIGLVMEKFKNFDVIRNQYLEIYGRETQTDYIKLKILSELRTLDKDELQMLQDLPYLTEFHADIRSDLDGLNADITANNNKSAEDNRTDDKPLNVGDYKQPIGDKPALPVNGFDNSPDDKEKTTDKAKTGIPIQEISPNKEIQDILSSRDQSGFTRFTKR